MSNIIEILAKLETAIVRCADATGKAIEHIGADVLDYLESKRQEAEDAKLKAAAEVAEANKEAAGSAETEEDPKAA